MQDIPPGQTPLLLVNGHIDPIYLLPPQVREHLSFHQFGQEEPTKQDWASWEHFWRSYCGRFLEPPSLLGNWKIPGHRIRPWLLDSKWDVVYHQNYDTLHEFIPLVERSTRLDSLYILLGEVNVVPTKVVPITVSKVEEDVVAVKEDRPRLPSLQPTKLLLWESLHAGGGDWMSDYVSDKELDPLWLKEALEQGTAIIATDGSYSRTRGPHISRAGWVITCCKTQKVLKGSFCEKSRDASPYRGELLGLVALHMIILHICKYYHVRTARGKIICNSKSALNQSSKQCRRVSLGTPQADLFRALRLIHQEVPGADLIYEWVKSHHDTRLPWRCLTLEEQLNTTCNTLTNSEVTRCLTRQFQQDGPNLLPFERSAVVIDGIKITSQIAPTVRFALGKVDAQRFYTKAIDRVRGSNKGDLGWSTEAFEAVDRETLARVTKINLEGFQLWLFKQAIGVCATQKNMARIQDILDDCCPNCGKRGEDSKHLNRCTDPGQIKLFRAGLGKLKWWMNRSHQTEPELTFWVIQYLLHRGQVWIANLSMLRPMSKTLQEAAESQDLIG
jgi:hypothetical protein